MLFRSAALDPALDVILADYMSMHDALTGLYNRAYFEEEMARLERGREFPVSVVMTDIDGLKKKRTTTWDTRQEMICCAKRRRSSAPLFARRR